MLLANLPGTGDLAHCQMTPDFSILLRRLTGEGVLDVGVWLKRMKVATILCADVDTNFATDVGSPMSNASASRVGRAMSKEQGASLLGGWATDQGLDDNSR